MQIAKPSLRSRSCGPTLILLACTCFIGASHAQLVCPQPLDSIISGQPEVWRINLNHIFCGEIVNANGGQASGFHSRPLGVNPVNTQQRAVSCPPPPVQSNVRINLGVVSPVNNGMYSMTNFCITAPRNGGGPWQTRIKGGSSMWPDACTQVQILASINHVRQNGGGWVNLLKSGPSSPAPNNANYCLRADGTAFNVLLIKAAGAGRLIYNAYPQ
ncbi:EndoU domain-containing protein [Polaromonas glacialis]|uniref:EndoU domain-containing protein n=1 Tax=Polaromonas glacialis TaxID=866564 RepID=UPI000A05DD2D